MNLILFEISFGVSHNRVQSSHLPGVHPSKWLGSLWNMRSMEHWNRMRGLIKLENAKMLRAGIARGTVMHDNGLGPLVTVHWLEGAGQVHVNGPRVIPSLIKRLATGRALCPPCIYLCCTFAVADFYHELPSLRSLLNNFLWNKFCLISRLRSRPIL